MFDFICHSRLNKIAGAKINLETSDQLHLNDNLNIADLSDKHRPTNIGEFYSDLYDNEWSEAFKVIKPLEYPNATEGPDDEHCEEVLRILKNILMVRKHLYYVNGFMIYI